MQRADSPGINAGRGLKPLVMLDKLTSDHDSPGINAGRGLKPGGRLA